MSTKNEGKPSHSREHWSAGEDQTLLIGRHVPIVDICKTLERPYAGLLRRLNTVHRDAYAASGHPSYQPAEGDALRGRPRKRSGQTVSPSDVLATPASAGQMPAIVTPLARVVPTIQDVTTASKIASLEARLSRLETELGVGA